MQRSGRLISAVAAVAFVGSLAGCARPGSFDSQLVSLRGVGHSFQPVANPDGTKVAFLSDATNLGPNDTNGLEDVYVRDLTTGTTTLVSANATNSDGGNGDSGLPVWSPDGTKITFATFASNLGPTDTNHALDVYVRDLTTSTTRLVSTNAAGTDSANESSFRPVFDNSSGRVAFESLASNMGSTDTNGTTDVYLRDLATNTTSLVSVNAQGTKAGNGTSVTPAFSPDGTAVSFTSDASDLGATDANGVFDVYLRDLSARTTHLVSSNTAGVAASGDSERPVFSPDGSQVAFLSTAGDMGPTDSNGQFDVYLQDLASHTNRLVSANSSGTDASDGTSGRFATFVFLPEFSPDGTRILFPSDGTDLVPADKDDLPDLFVRDLSAGTTSVVTANPDGTGTVGLSFDSAEGSPTDLTGDPAFDQTGTHVVFVSAETGFGPQDTNLSNDVYVRDLVAGTTQIVSSNAADSDAGNGASGSPVFLTGSQLRIAFASFGSNLGPEDVNGSMDVYLATQVP